MIRIVLINHSFQINYYSRRWELLAEQHPDLDVTLLAPEKSKWYNSKSYTYGNGGTVIKGKTVENGNFHIQLFRKRDVRGSDWYSPDLKKLLLEINPDVVYHIGSHTQLSLVQIIRIVKKHLPKTKILAFSMRGPHHNLSARRKKGMSWGAIKSNLSVALSTQIWRYVKKNVDVFFCHYPAAFNSFREEGWTGPLYIQTQVGVNLEWFHPDEKARQEIRNKYSIGDSFLFGAAARFSLSKGIDDILNALPVNGDWKFMIMGSGRDDEIERLHKIVSEKGIENRVIFPGFVDWYDMTKYWNAIDCAIHVPRSTQKWVETFSLSIVQAMATAKPIIGNDSGSVPFQIGQDNILVKEGDICALHEKMQWVMNNRDEARKIGEKAFDYASRSFSVQHLDDMFYVTLLDIMNGVYDVRKIDMTEYNTQ